jgi:4a-hydroxytetrahydrobiopterin dehydratase
VNILNQIAEIAEQENHHPNLKIFNYKNLEIEIYTHKIDGLHENDLFLLQK